MKIVAWHPLLTDHQAYTYGAAAAHVDAISVNVWRESDAIRATHGWQRRSPRVGEERLVPADRWFAWSRALLRREAGAWHLFGSPFEDRRQFAVMLMALAMGRRVGIVSEPYSTSGTSYFAARSGIIDRLKQGLRPLAYRAYGLMIARRLGVVFAISRLACAQYAAMGVPRGRIAPFGYFVPGPAAAALRGPHAPGGPLRAIFVGSLIERKGIDTAVAAVERLRAEGRAITLSLYGPGDPAAYAGREGVSYRGMLPFGDVADTLARHDVLLLPSRFDGWGVIGNEAIQAGLPVIVSDAAGVGDFVTAQGCGRRFRAGDVDDLAARLADWTDRPAALEDAAAAARRAAPLLDPQVAGDYLVRCLAALDGGAALPPSPWYPPFS